MMVTIIIIFNVYLPKKTIFTGSECLLTPECSIEIQNAIGADIIMQLDDVVSSTVSGPRVEEAMHRYF